MNQPSHNKHFSQRSQSSGGYGGGAHRHNSPERAAAQLQRKVFDSAGPDGKVRGTAQQVYEKYLAQARDAHGNGDRVLSENCLQHAEHYLRILNSLSPRARQQNIDEELLLPEDDDRFADLRGAQVAAARAEATESADAQPPQQQPQHTPRPPRHEPREYTPSQRMPNAEMQSGGHTPQQHRFAPRPHRAPVAGGHTPYPAPAPAPVAFTPQPALLEPAPVVPVAPIVPAQAGLPRGPRRGFTPPAAITAAKPDNMVFESPAVVATPAASDEGAGAPTKRRTTRRRSKGVEE